MESNAAENNNNQEHKIQSNQEMLSLGIIPTHERGYIASINGQKVYVSFDGSFYITDAQYCEYCDNLIGSNNDSDI